LLTTYTYDKNNRVTSITHPEVEPGQTPLATENFGYDEMGNLLWKQLGSEPADVYKCDDLNRLTDTWYSFTGTLEVPLTYPTAVDPDVHYPGLCTKCIILLRCAEATPRRKRQHLELFQDARVSGETRLGRHHE